MALAIDSSSPTIVGTASGTSVTTASFTPPDSSIIVACIGRFASSTVTMSNSGTALTWTLKADNGLSRIYTAPLTTSQSMTVTFAQSSSSKLGLKVYAVTGGDLSNPVGASGTGTASASPSTVNGYSSTVANSLGIASVAYLDIAYGTLASSDTAVTYTDGSSFALYGINKAATTASPSTTVTFNMSNSSSVSPDFEWSAVEILPLSPASGQAVVLSGASHRASIW